VWDLANDKDLPAFLGRTWPQGFSPDATRLAFTNDGSTVQIFDVATGRIVPPILTAGTPLASVAFSPDGYWLAVGAADGDLRVVNLLDPRPGIMPGAVLAVNSGPEEPLGDILFSPHGRVLALVHSSREPEKNGVPNFQLWSLVSNEIKTLPGSNGTRFAGFLRDSSVIVLENAKDKVALRRLSIDEEPDAYPLATREVHALTIIPGSPLVAIACDEGWLRLGHVETFAAKAHLRCFPDTTPEAQAPAATDVAASENGETLAAVAHDGSLTYWHVPTMRRSLLVSGHSGPLAAVAVSPDGQTVVTAGEDRVIRVRHLQQPMDVAQFEGHAAPVRCMGYAKNGTFFVSGDADGWVKLWNPDKGLLASFEAHEGDVLCLEVSPDSTRLATGGRNKLIKFWDTSDPSNPKLLSQLPGHDGFVTSVAFSPDGTSFASASRDRTIKLWDPDLLQEIITLKGPRQPIASIDFSTDGLTLVSATTGGEVRFWRGR
jgi:WD40 repeat protein